MLSAKAAVKAGLSLNQSDTVWCQANIRFSIVGGKNRPFLKNALLAYRFYQTVDFI